MMGVFFDSLPSARGFTLIEVMVVLIIIAVAAALVAPNVKGLGQRREIQVELRQLGLAVKVARSRAITVSVPHTLVIDPEQNAYWVEAPVLEEETGDDEYEEDPWRVVRPDERRYGADGDEDREEKEIEISMERTLPEFLRFADMERLETTWRRGREQAEEEEDDGLWRIRFWPDGTGEDVLVELTAEEGETFEWRVYGLLGRAELLEED